MACERLKPTYKEKAMSDSKDRHIAIDSRYIFEADNIVTTLRQFCSHWVSGTGKERSQWEGGEVCT
jgi:hypothetical protein